MLVLRELPPFGEKLVCGLSTQLHHQAAGLDEIISFSDEDFASSGLVTTSLIRLCFLGRLTNPYLVGPVGTISPERHARLLRRLSSYLIERLGV